MQAGAADNSPAALARLLRSPAGGKLVVGAEMKLGIRRVLSLAAGGVLLAGMGAAQRGPVAGGRYEWRTYGSPHGFGNVVFPGTGTAPRLAAPFSIPSSFPQRLGATVSGWPGYTGAPAIDPLRRRTAVVPMIWPVYVGGFYPYDPSASVTVISPPQQPSAPVTINQYFLGESAREAVRAPVERETVQTYQAPARPPAEAPSESVMFLIALRDSSVYSAVAYWIEGDTLHYITPQGKHNQVSLELVDRTLSEKLNQGRRVEFRLPPAK